MEGLQKQDEAREREVKSLQDALELQNDARQKEMKDLQHALKLQNDARQEEMKDLQQAMSSQNELRQKESMKNIETMDRISDQMRLMIRAVLPPSIFQREFFAVFTTIFFPWLVGPCEKKHVTTSKASIQSCISFKDQAEKLNRRDAPQQGDGTIDFGVVVCYNMKQYFRHGRINSILPSNA